MSNSVPIIDISALSARSGGQKQVADQIQAACRNNGFFYVINHGVSESLQNSLELLSWKFFNLPEDQKLKIRMELGGKAWRGFFPVGGELTSGKPDIKEGLYFGEELPEDHPKPLHGKNLFPEEIPDLKEVVLEYMTQLKNLGHQLMRGLSLSLGHNDSYLSDRYTADPFTLFRIFHYPSTISNPSTPQFGVGEHTDYGVLTILKQDAVGGLQIKSGEIWVDAPYLPNTFICNIGDMLEIMTGGYYTSTPHRVINASGKSRLSFPFFFDPNFDAFIQKNDLTHAEAQLQGSGKRWDGQNLLDYSGTYGDYILNKVSAVFPDLSGNLK